MSISYYDENAEFFIERTAHVDMSPIYERFLPLIPEGGSILDAGCGSGRDAKAFQDLGFLVTAFDASEAMCKSASELLGKPVNKLKFKEINWIQEFDGVWACASLLHVPQRGLRSSIERLMRSLKPEGVMYASFKYGAGERQEGERHFSDMNEHALKDVVRGIDCAERIEMWVAESRKEQSSELWLNAIITKRS